MNFREHILFGIFVGIAFSSVLLLYEGISLFIFMPLLLAILGSVLPDIDHHASIPFRILKIFVFLSFFLSSFLVLQEHSEILSSITENFSAITGIKFNVEMINFFTSFLIGLTAGVLSAIILEIIRPAHRGIAHKKTTGIFIGILLFLFFHFFFSNQNFLIITTLSFVTGFFSHLALDKILLKM